MELRDQDKDIGMPNSMGYIPPEPSQELFSRLSAAPTISSLADRRRNETAHGRRNLSPSQTLDHHQFHHHQLNQQPPAPSQTRGIYHNPDPDPAQLEGATTASASKSKTPPPSQSELQQEVQTTTSATINASLIRYQECLKNHAANTGRHVVDGCGEFMPSGEDGTLEALKCAACDCHRNFHRKGVIGESQFTTNCHHRYNPNINSSQRTAIHPNPHPTSSLSAPPNQQHYKYPHNYSHGLTSPSRGPMMMAFGGRAGAPADSSSEDLNMFQTNAGAQPTGQPPFSVSKKRFRTKFTQEQKNMMHEFAEKLGWKIQKQDEQEVQQFCDQVSVTRQVFKVWMHNNKQAMKTKQM